MRAEFLVSAGQTVPFVLAYSPSYLPLPDAVVPDVALGETTESWKEWTKQHTDGGPFADAVPRSQITLKALTSQPTGGIVAAPTTSLPEQLGGPRNWDYRFCWLRDATFSLLALMNSGYYDEARAWRDWLLRAAAGSPQQIQIMYGIGGARRLPEWPVPGLVGSEGPRPARRGSAPAPPLSPSRFGAVDDATQPAAR